MDVKQPSQLPQETIEKLIRQSHEAKTHAYCVYSKFRVGAAVLTEDDRVFTGKAHLSFHIFFKT